MGVVTEPVKPGDRIRVLKGARVFSTAPGWPLQGKIAPCEQSVTAASVEPEARSHHQGREVTIPGRVRWKGAGGYWRWTDLKNTEQEKLLKAEEGN